MSLKLSQDQEKACEKLVKFLTKSASKQFLLEGYAGTGKTTIYNIFSMILNFII